MKYFFKILIFLPFLWQNIFMYLNWIFLFPENYWSCWWWFEEFFYQFEWPVWEIWILDRVMCLVCFLQPCFLLFYRMCTRHSMSSWGGSLKKTTLKLSWKRSETWWTQNVWCQTGCMISYWAMVNRMQLITPSKREIAK